MTATYAITRVINVVNLVMLVSELEALLYKLYVARSSHCLCFSCKQGMALVILHNDNTSNTFC